MPNVFSCMRTSFLILTAVLLNRQVAAQSMPQIAKVSTATSFSAFLFGSLTASRNQLLYLPGDLAGATAGNISRLYFMHAGSNATTTLTNLTISLGQTTNTAFVPATSFYQNLTPVLTSATYTIPAGTIGQWFAIDLDNGFAFDPSQTLILDVSFTGNTNVAFGTYGDPTSRPNASGKKLYAGSPTATTGSTTSSTWQHFGFDLGPTGLPAQARAAALVVAPNPATDAVTIQLPAARPEPAELILTDALGRIARRLSVNGQELPLGIALPLRGIAPGPYVLEVRQRAQRLTRRLIVQ